MRLTADGAADVASGLAAAANGLALLDDPAKARDPPRSPGIFVAEYLPALVNALRVFLGEHPEHPLTHQARHLV